PAIAAIGAAELDELLAPERDGAGAAIAALHEDLGLVEEFHEAIIERKRGKAALPPSTRRPMAERLFGGRRRLRHHGDGGWAARRGVERDRALDEGEDGVVAAQSDIVARMELGAALAHDDVAGHDDLAAEALDAEAASLGIAAVARGAAGFLMRHL